MRNITNIFILIVLANLITLSQTIQISGTITDIDTKASLHDVNVTVKESGIYTHTDIAGKFSISVKKTEHLTFLFDKIGYKSQRIVYTPEGNHNHISINLSPTIISFGEVIISSTKYEQFIKETPLPIEVSNKECIFKTSSVGVSDALRNSPGIVLVRDGIWGTDINIRGLSRQNVVTLVDGNRIETASNHAASLSLVDIMDVENVEVIKGGISSLYGTGATGGVVSIKTKKPSYTDKLSMNGSVISGYNTVNSGSAEYISLSAASSFWYGKISGTTRSAQNVSTPSGTLPNSYFRDKNYSAAFGIKPFEDHQLLFNFQDFVGDDIGIPGGRSFPQTDASRARYTKADRLMYSAEYKINNVIPSLSNVSLKYFNQKISRDVELKPAATQTLLPGADHNTYGVQLLTNWVINDISHLVAGVDMWQRSYEGFRKTISVSGTTTKITGDYPVPNSKYRSLGLYGQEDWQLFDNNLHLNVGGRYDVIHISNDAAKSPAYIITNGVINNNPPQNLLTSYTAGSHNDQSWSANIGALYTITSFTDVTLNVSHAFRSPVLEERYQYINLGGDIYLGNQNLRPEIGNFVDVGIRMHGAQYNVKVNVFSNYFTDLVADVPVIKDSLYQKTNIGRAHLYGFDSEFEYNIFSGCVPYAVLSFVRGKDTGNNSDLSQIPPLNARYGMKYHLPELGEVNLSCMSYASQNNVGTGEARTPGYTVFNLYVSTIEFNYSALHVQISSGIENMFNRLYRDHLSTNRGLIKAEPGRNYFLKLALHW